MAGRTYPAPPIAVTDGSVLIHPGDDTNNAIRVVVVGDAGSGTATKYARGASSSSGVIACVAAVTAKKIRVLRFAISSNGTTNVKFQSHVSPTDISRLMYLTQFSGGAGGYCPVGHFETVAGEALDLNNSQAIAISWDVTYLEV